MGFGLLFIGYFITFLMSINSFGFIFELVGYTVMLYAVSKLAEYKSSIRRVIYPIMGMAIGSLYSAAVLIHTEFMPLPLPLLGTATTFIFSAIGAISTIVFHFFLLLPIRSIANDVGDKSLAASSVLVLITSCLGCSAEPVGAIIGAAITQTISNSQNASVGIIGGADGPTAILVSNTALPFVPLFAQIIFPLLTLIFLFFCYMRICAPEDVEMQQKPSRFAFINRLREKQAERDAETARERAEYQRKAQEKRNAKKHKKKRK